MAITRNARAAAPPMQNSISLEEGEVIEDTDSIASSREGSPKDEAISPPPKQTQRRDRRSNAKADALTRNANAAGTPATTDSAIKPMDVKVQAAHAEVKPAPAVTARRLSELTETDLERAKSLVLDLLGWGVPPEYLVEHGVSPEIIVRIFTELNLRMPSNIVVGALSQKR
ncbi:hypothetical protein OE88DRAFT_1668009 [Heliocybe sulcata]|uniref:Uncharacterized protein n=1 Tax=Heliocybe sulcata TaxID=5364 RepID=A0A5C3MMP3_9AGAM|nr:hypothetical protein OE88DRAFT_1668009 [Heliocybe sulcata]